MKNTESGPPRSPGPLMHVNNDPGQSPARRMWSACALPTAAGSPGSHQPSSSGALRQLFLQNLGVQTAGFWVSQQGATGKCQGLLFLDQQGPAEATTSGLRTP